jgi:hypothetical protein
LAPCLFSGEISIADIAREIFIFSIFMKYQLIISPWLSKERAGSEAGPSVTSQYCSCAGKPYNVCPVLSLFSPSAENPAF